MGNRSKWELLNQIWDFFVHFSQFRGFFMGNVSKIQFIDFALEDFQPVESCQRPLVFVSIRLSFDSSLLLVKTNSENGGVGMNVPQDSSSRLHSFDDQNICPTRVYDATKYSQVRCSSRVSTLAWQSYLRMMRRLVFSSCFLSFLSQFPLHCHSLTSLTRLYRFKGSQNTRYG